MDKSITFLMLVTDKDCMFGDYAIKSFNKIYKQLKENERSNFTVFIYLNNVNKNHKARYLPEWSKLPYTSVFDNTEKIKLAKPKAGEIIVSPENIIKYRDDENENYDEIWSTELSKFKSDYIATVDADFEILNADFYFRLINQLEDVNCIGASTSYSKTEYCYDSYSGRNIFLHERNHTWFCIYKKEAFELSKRSHFYYEKKTAENEVYAYDSAAYFQEDLRVNSKKTFTHLPIDYHNSFIHYGAGSKNKSINHRNLALYRNIFILTNVGLIHKATTNKIIQLINKLTIKIAFKLFKKRLHQLRIERSTYNY